MNRRIAAATLTMGLVAAAVSQQVSRAAGPVSVDPDLLPQHLAETGLYASKDSSAIADGVRPFLPQYPLWSDGMRKRRWVYLPKGSSIDATSELSWDYPVGTKFWKEFSLNGRRIETRMSWKTSSNEWQMVSYVWNDVGTDATIVPPDGMAGVVELGAGRRHSIPSRTDCRTCHGTTSTGPLGFNPLQLSDDRDPNAIHGEPLTTGMVTLRGLISKGLLSPAPTHFATDPPRIRTADAVTRSVLGYLAANCVMCHNGSSDGTPLGPALAMRELLQDGDGAARTLIGRTSAWQVPGAAEGHSEVVHPGSPDSSALFVRLRSRAPSSQMPPLGTVLRDQEAIDAIGRWIGSMSR